MAVTKTANAREDSCGCMVETALLDFVWVGVVATVTVGLDLSVVVAGVLATTYPKEEQ